MATLKIETGLKRYDIADKNGEVRGSISFNPKDMNFPVRAKELIENIEKWKAEIDETTVDTEGAMTDRIDYFDSKVKQAINELFDDENTSKVVFGNQNCFNTLNGVTFIERFLNSVMPVIKKDIEEEQSKSKKRLDKYTEILAEE